MMKLLKENSLSVQAARKAEAELPAGTIVRGVLHDEDKPEFTELYDEVIEAAHGSLPPRERHVRRGWL
jgi:2-oxoglutarate ferredoxin oxidoreductase subunit beta